MELQESPMTNLSSDFHHATTAIGSTTPVKNSVVGGGCSLMDAQYPAKGVAGGSQSTAVTTHGNVGSATLRGQAGPAVCTLGLAAPLRAQRGAGVVSAAPGPISHVTSPAAFLAPPSSSRVAFFQNNLCAQVNPEQTDARLARSQLQEDTLRQPVE